MPSGKKRKHIKDKFFFIKDRVDGGEIKVIDCPTREMRADIMTKPLQGTSFRVMRAELMNCPVNYEDPETEEETHEAEQPISARKMVAWRSEIATPFMTPQECVGQNRIHTNKSKTDRCLGGTRYPHRNTGSQLGTARLGRMTWQVGVFTNKRAKQ